MDLPWQIVAAAFMDLLAGDPRWFPHPVRGIGWLCMVLERTTRRLCATWPGLAGLVTVTGVLGTAVLLAWGIADLTSRLHPLVGGVAGAVMIYTAVAARDLVRHSNQVFRALRQGDLPEARRRVGWMVGRDTGHMDEGEIARAAVESVAESIVDGVTAPLLYAALFGPVGAVAYRAINTMDSMFGYRNERYLKFGRTAARLDDLANFIPARLTGPVIVLAASVLSRRGRGAWRVLRRDAHQHPSPNSGWAEAAVAGALGVRLGGLNYYSGVSSHKPYIGDLEEPLEAAQILQANRLMMASAGIFLLLCLGIASLLH